MSTQGQAWNNEKRETLSSGIEDTKKKQMINLEQKKNTIVGLVTLRLDHEKLHNLNNREEKLIN